MNIMLVLRSIKDEMSDTVTDLSFGLGLGTTRFTKLFAKWYGKVPLFLDGEVNEDLNLPYRNDCKVTLEMIADYYPGASDEVILRLYYGHHFLPDRYKENYFKSFSKRNSGEEK